MVWGSTYLAIRVALETLPPFFLAGGRFLAAGAFLYWWLRLRGVARPTPSQWWAAVMTGTLMLVGGAGGVTWAEQRVSSSVACLLITTVPMWMTLIEAAQHGRFWIGWRVSLGLLLGLAGVSWLLGPASRELLGVDLLGAGVVLAAALSWSLGSLVSAKANLPSSPAMTVAVQMLTAGVPLMGLSAGLGEWRAGLLASALAPRSLVAVVYLVVFGSIISLSAYVWLLRQVSAAAVSTYAFVNPLVAVFLGWLVLAEPVGPEVFLATGLIVGAVVLIQSATWWRPQPQR